jgi:hypothetical protein
MAVEKCVVAGKPGFRGGPDRKVFHYKVGDEAGRLQARAMAKKDSILLLKKQRAEEETK